LEDQQTYQVELTSKAKIYYYQILEYFYTYSSVESADKKSAELYKFAYSLQTFPDRGQIETNLSRFKKNHRFILFNSTSKAVIKIIYFVDKKDNTVYITDFFPTYMDQRRIQDRA
jgi:translation initiation factor 2B subunit (eIF-2B alpha/beta/delta family)